MSIKRPLNSPAINPLSKKVDTHMSKLTPNSKKKWLASFALITSVGITATTVTFSDDFISDASIDTVKTSAQFSEVEKAIYLAGSQPLHRLPDGNTAGEDLGTDTDTTWGLALGDVNRDGYLDLVTGNSGQTNKVYIYDIGNDSFAAIGTNIGSETDASYSVVLADIDKDGDLDLVAGNYGQTNKLYLYDSVSSSFSAAGTVIGSDTDNTWETVLGDVDGDGDLDIVAVNKGQTNKLYLNDGTGSFTIGAGTNIGSDLDNTQSITLGDVDGDGDLDLVTGNENQTNKLYLNDGSGNFSTIGAAISNDLDDTVLSSLADFDGDGDLDLMTANYGTSHKLYLNNGSGVFDTGTAIGSGTDNSYTGFVTDVDNDGDLDLLTGNNNQTNTLYFNDGRGGFTAGTAVGSDTDATRALAFADVDHDGQLDLVVGNENQTNKLYQQENQGDFTATGLDISSETNNSHNLAWGDVDKDNDIDLVIGNSGVNRLYLSDGKGRFTAGTNIGSETDISEAPILVDIDADGDLDLVVGNYSQTNKVYFNDGTGSFSATGTAIGTETDNTWAIALGDLDGDGDIDLVAGNENRTNKVYLNDGSGSFGAGANIGTDTDDTYDITLVDINGDGHLDAVAGNFLQTTKVYLNDGNAVFAAGSDLNTDAGKTRRVLFADLDNDGDMDLVAGNDSAVNKLYLNDGSGNFPATGTDLGSEADERIGLALADMDNDGDIDVVAGNYSKTNKLYLNDGNAGFSATGIEIGSETDQTFAIALVDYDGDGDIDVLSANANQTNKLYLNNGNTSFTNTGTDFGSDSGQSVTAAYADIDKDGDIDLVVGNESETNQLFLNDGSGNFPAVGTDIGNDTDSTQSIALADVDNDGDLDVIAGNFSAINKLYLNDGSGGFSGTGTDIGSESDTTTAIAVGDVNSDGYIDLVVGNSGAVENKLYLNDGNGGFSATGINIGSEADSTFSIALQDINKDGWLDIIVGNEQTTNKRYLNDGNGGFPATGINIGIETDDTASLSFADIDNNGTVDIITGNYFQPNRLYFNNGNAVFSAVGTNIGSESDSTRTVIFADIDKDGDKDILVSNQSNTNKIYYNNGQGAFPAIGVDINSVAANTRAMVVADIDKDGDLDLMAFNRGLANKLYKQLSYNIHGHEVYSTKVNGSVTEVVDVTLTATATTNTATTRNTSIYYYVSNNGGEKWYGVKSGVEFTFPETSTDDIRWRAQLNSLSPVITPILSNVELSYTGLPKITGATYDIVTGKLTVTGINFSDKSGTANDIDASMFSFTGEASDSYTLTDTANVDVTSSTEFTLPLSATDKAKVNVLINKSGSVSNDGTVYNLAAAEDWNTGAKASLIIADSTTAITASKINIAPTINGVPDTTVAEGASYSFIPTVTDVNPDDTQSFSIINQPSWATFSSATGELSGTPDNDDAGITSNIVIKVTDSGGLNASLAAFNITVTNTNYAPMISGTPAMSVVEGENYSFTPIVTDDDTQRFTITNKPVWATFNTTTGQLSGMPTSNAVNITAGIVITVTDSAGVSASLPAFIIQVISTDVGDTATSDTVTENSKGASVGFMLITLIGLALYRFRRQYFSD